jgi:hypothetical protein
MIRLTTSGDDEPSAPKFALRPEALPSRGKPAIRHAGERPEQSPKQQTRDGHGDHETVRERLRDLGVRVGQFRRAEQMGRNNQAKTQHRGPGRALQKDEAETRGGCRGGRDPPDLTKLHGCGRNAGRFGGQPKTRRHRKDHETAQAPEQALVPIHRAAPQRIDSCEQQRKSNCRQDIGRCCQRVALQAFRGLPCRRVMLMSIVLASDILAHVMLVDGVIPDGRSFDRRGRRLDSGFLRLALICLGFENKRHGAKMLYDRDGGAANQPTDNGGKDDRTKDGHLWSVAGKSIRMANIVRGVVDSIDMRKTDNAHDEQAESHGQHGLEHGAQAIAGYRTGYRQIGGVRLLHNGTSLNHKDISSRSGKLTRLLNFDLPSHIPAGEVKIDPIRDVFPDDLGSGRGMEGALVDLKEGLTIAGLRPEPQQRSEGQPMHHAEAAMIVRLKRQCVDVIAPVRWTSLLMQRRPPARFGNRDRMADSYHDQSPLFMIGSDRVG